MTLDSDTAEEIRDRHRRHIPLLSFAALSVMPLLGGCAAAIVAPVVLAGGAITKVGKDDSERHQREEVAAAVATVPDQGQRDQVATVTIEPPVAAMPASPPPPTPSAALSPVPAAPVPKPGFDLSASPPPAQQASAAVPLSVGEWKQFVDFSLARRQAFGGPVPVASALLVPDPPLEEPDRLPCTNKAPAVVVDLDQGRTAFSPKAGMQAPAGLGAALEQLRKAGVVVMWLSDANVNSVSQIGDLLKQTGLDPWGRDPLLLAKPGGDRKQLARIEANESACIIAIAGDRRGDFDELFDYLRVPSSAAGLDAMLGNGWFVVPPPLESVQ